MASISTVQLGGSSTESLPDRSPARYIVVRVEGQPGSKLIFNQFIKASHLRDCASWNQVWQNVVLSRLTFPAESSFTLKTATVSGNPGEFEGVNVDMCDETNGILDMGITSVLFEGDFNSNNARIEPKKLKTSLSSSVKTPVLNSKPTLPNFKDSSRPAYSRLFDGLRTQLESHDCVGFTDTNRGKKLISKLVKGLYSLSTFHDSLPKRSCNVPEYFAFSKNADDFRAKKNKAPLMTHKRVDDAKTSFQIILDDPFVSTEISWEPFKKALQEFVQGLETVLPALALEDLEVASRQAPKPPLGEVSATEALNVVTVPLPDGSGVKRSAAAASL